jgi:hypothetical protein
MMPDRRRMRTTEEILAPVFGGNLDSLPFPSWEEFDLFRYPGVLEQGELTIEKLLYYQQKSYLNHPIKWEYSWPEDELDRTKKKASQRNAEHERIVAAKTGCRSRQASPCG